MKWGRHSPALPPIVPLLISHRVKIITVSLRERFPGFPASGLPISTAMLAPQALPLFLKGPRFDLWENSWQIAMSILMDDIIWTILLIMYDYLFLFSLVAIDPQLQQLKKGGITIAFSWGGHQAKRALVFCSLETHKWCSDPWQRVRVDSILDDPKTQTEARQVECPSFGRWKKYNSERQSALPKVTQLVQFKSSNLGLSAPEQVFISFSVASRWKGMYI